MTVNNDVKKCGRVVVAYLKYAILVSAGKDLGKLSKTQYRRSPG
jgi:hypothetical protein